VSKNENVHENKILIIALFIDMGEERCTQGFSGETSRKETT
jgi:hypothetical protein